MPMYHQTIVFDDNSITYIEWQRNSRLIIIFVHCSAVLTPDKHKHMIIGSKTGDIQVYIRSYQFFLSKSCLYLFVFFFFVCILILRFLTMSDTQLLRHWVDIQMRSQVCNFYSITDIIIYQESYLKSICNSMAREK